MIERCASHISSSGSVSSESSTYLTNEGYGLLYSVYAIGLWKQGYPMNGIPEHTIIPNGWRLPTYHDLLNLRQATGYNTRNAGRYLKAEWYPNPAPGTGGNNDFWKPIIDVNDVNGLWKPCSNELLVSHPSWKYQRTATILGADWKGYNGIDILGFSAIPAGYRNYFGGWHHLGGHFSMWVDNPNIYLNESYYTGLKLEYRNNEFGGQNLYICDGATIRFCRNKGSNPNSGTITDYEGNVYDYVTIDDLQWTVQNYRTRYYRNGDLIKNGNNNEDWEDASIRKTRIINVGGTPREVSIVNKPWFIGREGVWCYPNHISAEAMNNVYPY